MISLLVWFVIACAILGFLYYVIGALVPPPAQRVAYVFLALIALIVMIYLLMDVAGSSHMHHFRLP